MKINNFYYALKPIFPRKAQIYLRRLVINHKKEKYRAVWPIDPDSTTPPVNWKGWPDEKNFALVLTHDVDTQKGHDKCDKLMSIEEELGFRSSFNFVPERYKISFQLINHIKQRGFEIGVHGLKHDGKLYNSRIIFQKRAIKINQYLKDWGAVGFRSPAMHHNLEWIDALNIEYDASTFDTDPFEPQSDGVKTIFPFIVSNVESKKSYVELPYTLPQDFTLFILMREKNFDIWKKKVAWINFQGGLVLLNVHPDYINFGDTPILSEEYPISLYKDFLKHLMNEYKSKYWHILPKELASYIKRVMSEKTYER